MLICTCPASISILSTFLYFSHLYWLFCHLFSSFLCSSTCLQASALPKDSDWHWLLKMTPKTPTSFFSTFCFLPKLLSSSNSLWSAFFKRRTFGYRVAIWAITSLFAQLKLAFKVWVRSSHTMETDVLLWDTLSKCSLPWQRKSQGVARNPANPSHSHSAELIRSEQWVLFPMCSYQQLPFWHEARELLFGKRRMNWRSVCLYAI